MNKQQSELRAIKRALRSAKQQASGPWPVRDDQDRLERLGMLIRYADKYGEDALPEDGRKILRILESAQERMTSAGA